MAHVMTWIGRVIAEAQVTSPRVRTLIEPVVAAAQVASSFYDTALLFAVKNYYNHSIASLNTSDSDMLQKSISNFYIIHNLILGLVPLLSAYILAKIGDRQRRKVTISVPLFGYLISRSLLLLVILLDWPIEVMFGSAALNGLTGWFTTYWAGVMAWASESSSEQKRSLKFIVIELVYGIAGFIVPQHENTGIVNYGHVSSAEPTESSKLLGGIGKEPPLSTSSVTPSRGIIALLFASAILYNVAVDGCVDVLSLFLLNKPLNFNPEYIGYANAAGYMIFITSFLAVFVSSRWFKDVTLILIGIASFTGGIFIMAFVRWTFLFFIARAVMMFALIPLPTIRSVLSKHIQGSSYGKLFVVLQLSLAISGVLTSVVFNKIYQVTLEKFNGTCFIISGIIAIFSLIPISWWDHQRKMLTWYDTSTFSSGHTGAHSFRSAKHQGLNHYLLEMKDPHVEDQAPKLHNFNCVYRRPAGSPPERPRPPAPTGHPPSFPPALLEDNTHPAAPAMPGLGVWSSSLMSGHVVTLIKVMNMRIFMTLMSRAVSPDRSRRKKVQRAGSRDSQRDVAAVRVSAYKYPVLQAIRRG
ncbi:unnamed protein product [Ranitomeya imitator]|uniref:Uncharacterized protein n=1 Tax=Ranitomeya imitator TaxID=111125 RepID=A0ABN9LJT9_9NEOB|nr:unnamed protein product [Ranitomeya imitator]